MGTLILDDVPLLNKPHSEMDEIDRAVAEAAKQRVERARQQMAALAKDPEPFTPLPSLTEHLCSRQPRVGPRGKIVRSDVAAIPGADRLVYLIENDYRFADAEPVPVPLNR